MTYTSVAANRMFIALGMAAEIVMVVEDQDLFIRAMLLLIKVSCRQSAEPATNNNQVVSLRQIAGRSPVRSPGPCTGMCVIAGTRVAPPGSSAAIASWPPAASGNIELPATRSAPFTKSRLVISLISAN